jgi:hypothetical protein
MIISLIMTNLMVDPGKLSDHSIVVKPLNILLMETYLYRKCYAITAVLSFVIIFNACAQSTETKYFKDVTTTNLPIDAKAHALDEMGI